MASASPFDDPVPKRSHTRNIDDAVRDTVKLSRNYTSTNKPLPSPTGRRTLSQDSAVSEKPRATKSRPKKGSQHADVIDRLDFTGVGPMFHHDGPFDACAPSRNKQHSKAPMAAWTPQPEDVIRSSTDGPYGGAHAYDAFSPEEYTEPKKKVDAIAEAWGIHEPEPFEEFFAGGGTRGDTPASSIYNGKDSHSRSSNKRNKDSRSPRSNGRRSAVPPPQPIFIGDTADEVNPSDPSSPPVGTGAPKRSKSLMHRIRRMRETPNVPVGDYGDQSDATTPPADSSSSPTEKARRPSHRPQNSLMGKFGGGSPREEFTSEPYVVVETHTNKDLPATPMGRSHTDGYFDSGYSSAPGSSSPGGGLNRKTSLMKRMGRVVRGTR